MPELTRDKKDYHDLSVHFIYLCFFVSLFFTWRAVSSISIGLILLAGLFSSRKVDFIRKPKSYLLFIAACADCFLLSVISLLYTQNDEQQWEHIRLQSGLLIIPLAVLFSYEIIQRRRQLLLFHFTLLLLAACLYCIFNAFYQSFRGHDTGVFFYHQLVSPVKGHAVYYSVFVFVALLFLIDGFRNGGASLSKTLRVILIVFFSVFLFLLSSRLVIAFYILYLLFWIIGTLYTGQIPKKMAIGSLIFVIALTTVLLTTRNPISQRFNDILKGDMSLVNKKQFDPADYFNGIQLRLVEWRFVTTILNEQESWVLGVSPGDAQQALNEKYISSNMYIGEKDSVDKGFIGYNTHNQFLQSLLQNGLIGVLVFLFAFISLAAMAFTAKRKSYTVLVLLVLVYSCIESILETQYGIVLFAFFPLFLYPQPQTRELVNS